MGQPHEIHNRYLAEMEKQRLENYQAEVYTDFNQNDEHLIGEALPQSNEVPIKEIELPDSSATGDTQRNAFKHNFLSIHNTDIVHKGTQQIYFTEMYLTDSAGEETVFFETGADAVVHLKFKHAKANLKGTLCLLLYRDDGTYCYGTNTFIESKKIVELSQYSYLKVILKAIPLLPGKYSITLAIHDEDADEYEHIDHAAFFQIYSNRGEQGIIRIETEWNLE